MKVFLKEIMLICAIFASNALSAQNNLTVQFFKKDCSDCETTFLVKELTILKDDQIFKKIDQPNSFAFYESVPDGKYSFRYTNIFGEAIDKEIVLPNNTNSLNGLEIALYVDKLQDSIPTDLVIQKIKNDEKIAIKFRFSGCFNSGKDSLIISKNKDQLYVLHKRKKRKLKPHEIEFLMKYENELKHLKEAGFASTANGINEVIYNSEKLYYVEPSIYWGGYDLLKKRLKLK